MIVVAVDEFAAEPLTGSWRHVARAQMRTLRASGLYFALVFGAGFTLGVIRVLWVVPRLGVSVAELIEAPVMIAVSAIVACWVIRHLGVPPKLSIRVTMGAIALLLMLVAELTLVLWVRGVSIREYFASRDPVSESVYYVSLAVFAVMPLLAGRR